MKIPTWVEEEEFIALIKKTLSKHHKMAFLLAFESGLRVSEIAGRKRIRSKCCKAEIKDVKEKIGDKIHKKFFCGGCQSDVKKKGKINCYESKEPDDWAIPPLNPDRIDIKRKSMTVIAGKGGKDRIAPLPKHWRQDYMKLLPMKCGVRSLQKAFDSAAKRTGLKTRKPNISIHKLRHGFATRLVNQGMPINQVQLFMGHSNVSTTSVYTHANPKDALKNYEGMF